MKLKNKSNLREYIVKLLNEVQENEWQYTATANVFKNVGLVDFIASLPPDKKRKLRDELSHHMLTGLTAPMGYVQMGDKKRAVSTMKSAIERYEWLIKNIMGS